LRTEHPLTQRFASHYARLMLMTDRGAEALRISQIALSTHARINGSSHPWTKDSARVTADALDALDRADEAKTVRATHDFTRYTDQ
jgi:hypothetical protein